MLEVKRLYDNNLFTKSGASMSQWAAHPKVKAMVGA